MKPVYLAAGVVAVLFTMACGSSPSAGVSPTSPTPVTGSGGTSTVTGTWTGLASDSTGSMMGAGMSSSMMNGMTWQISQTGNTFTGVMQFAGYAGRSGMTVSGTITGNTATFTMTMPNGSMMTGTCSATATGTFDLDALFTQMHGAYTGSNTCMGPFGQGQISMIRR